MERLCARLEAGEESETPGLLEQWLREGKLSVDDAIVEASGMFMAGVDTVLVQKCKCSHVMHITIDCKPECLPAVSHGQES